MAVTPYTHPLLFKSIIVNGIESPGVVTLSGYPRDQEWEDQKAKGTAGTTSINHGRKNTNPTASFYLADLEDVEAWESFQRMLLESIDGPKPKALIVAHPDLLRNRVLEFVVASIGDMVWDDKGGATVVVKFKEYRPPKPRPAVKAEAGKGPSQATRDPNAARKAELAALVAQAKAP